MRSAWPHGAVARLMTPFNCPTAHASSHHHVLPRLLLPLLLRSSSYSLLPSRHGGRRFASDSSPASVDSTGQNSHTFMEVVREVFKHSSAHGARGAIRADHKSYSFVQLISSALDVHNILCRKNDADDSSTEGNKTGFLHGARIGIVAKPSPEFVAGIFGTWLSGGVAVPLALSYPEVELLHVMNDSDISMVLSTKEHHEIMESISIKCSTRYSLLPAVESISSALTSSVSSLMAGIDNLKKIEGDDPALILYTSGTTGKPKGVVHTHKGILSQVQILTEAWGYQSEDQFLHCLPLHHIHKNTNAKCCLRSSTIFCPSIIYCILKQNPFSFLIKIYEGTCLDDIFSLFYLLKNACYL